MVRIETERLVLREWRDEDFAALHALCTCPRVMATIGPLHDEERTHALLARLQERQSRDGCTFWAVERKADAALLGFCGIKIADTPGSPIEGEHEVGWRLREDAWGKGYAKEAALASLRAGFETFDAPEIIAITIEDNTASWGLMERLGMQRRPDLDFRCPEFLEEELIVYAIDRASWLAGRSVELPA